MGGLLGGPKGMLAPPLKLLGGGGGAWPPLAPPLPTPMLYLSVPDNAINVHSTGPRVLQNVS